MKKDPPSIAVSMFLPISDRAALLKAFLAVFDGPVKADARASEWKACVVRLKEGELRAEVKVQKRRGDAFSGMVLGMWNASRRAKLPAKERAALESAILKTEMIVGIVIEASPREAGRALDRVAKVLRQQKGYLFVGDALVDPKGMLIPIRGIR